MPGGAKKAVFPTMNMHNHENTRETAAEHRKQLVRGKSTDGGKESPEKEKDPNAKHKSGKNPPMTKTMSGHSTDGHHSGHHHHHHHHQQQPDMKQQTQQHHSHHHHHHHGSHPQPHEQAKNVEASSTTSAK